MKMCFADQTTINFYGVLHGLRVILIETNERKKTGRLSKMHQHDIITFRVHQIKPNETQTENRN